MINKEIDGVKGTYEMQIAELSIQISQQETELAQKSQELIESNFKVSLKTVEIDEEVKPPCNHEAFIAELEAKHVVLQDENCSKEQKFQE